MNLLAEALRITRRSRTSSGLLMLGMGLGWLLLFQLLLLVGSSHQLMSGAFRQVPADIYLHPDVSEAERLALHSLVDSLDQLEWRALVSPEEAAAQFREAFGQDPQALLGENPFPWSVELRLPLGGELERMEAQLDWLGTQPAVEEVRYSRGLLERVGERLQSLALWLAASLVLLLALNAILLRLAWRSMLRNWSRELRVMALLGASPARIRAPLQLTAVIQGLLPALLAWALCVCQIALAARWNLQLTSPVPLVFLLPPAALLLPLLEWRSLEQHVRRAYDRD
ncbi:MAG: permease-like cell division protein FtsX [Candidatus Cloacimonetes bacterium]|nr:permease-like cell division protein FtsX [Candidatus Cloacimonadota bacterium]